LELEGEATGFMVRRVFRALIFAKRVKKAKTYLFYSSFCLLEKSIFSLNGGAAKEKSVCEFPLLKAKSPSKIMSIPNGRRYY